MLTPPQVAFVQEELKTAKNPLFFYDDDGDGLCAFLLLWRIHKLGKGVMVKSSPKLDMAFFRKVEEYNPDKILVLDIPLGDQEFVDKANRPIFWIDHHQPLDLKKVHYYNPRIKDPEAYIPTTRMAWQISQDPNDLWIAMTGCLYDWHMPDFASEFVQKYPELMPEECDLSTAVYQHPVGKLVRIFSFLLKGSSSDVSKSIKILTRINTPHEILLQESASGRYLYKRFEKINQKYEPLIEEAKKKAGRGKLLLFYYTEQQWSFTSDLANELINLHPQKVVIIARKKSGEMKCSLRGKTPIADVLEKALVGINGYGGGHPNACGAVIKEEDWERFLENFKRELKELKEQ